MSRGPWHSHSPAGQEGGGDVRHLRTRSTQGGCQIPVFGGQAFQSSLQRLTLGVRVLVRQQLLLCAAVMRCVQQQPVEIVAPAAGAAQPRRDCSLRCQRAKRKGAAAVVLHDNQMPGKLLALQP